MRTILKGVEPRSLTEHRQAPGANYENYQDKETLRPTWCENNVGSVVIA